MVHILVVDDEAAVRSAIRRALTFDGYDVEEAGDGVKALDLMAVSPPDAVIVDVLMPRLDGLEFCRRLRAAGDRTPILILTVRSLVSDRVAGLDTGADDYLVKPFALEELLARVRALLRRAPGSVDVLRFGDVTFDLDSRVVTRNCRAIETTRTESALLELFMRYPRQVLTREQIFEGVWGYKIGANSNSLEVYVGYLRRKLEADDQPRLIHTVRGMGYVMREP